jgi:hypothetical protein
VPFLGSGNGPRSRQKRASGSRGFVPGGRRWRNTARRRKRGPPRKLVRLSERPSPSASKILDAHSYLGCETQYYSTGPDPAIAFAIAASTQTAAGEREVIISLLNEVLEMHGSVEDNASRQQRSWQDRPRSGPRITLVRRWPARARRLDFVVLNQRSNGIATMRR